jgi:hypothetical protein
LIQERDGGPLSRPWIEGRHRRVKDLIEVDAGRRRFPSQACGDALARAMEEAPPRRIEPADARSWELRHGGSLASPDQARRCQIEGAPPRIEEGEEEVARGEEGEADAELAPPSRSLTGWHRIRLSWALPRVAR